MRQFGCRSACILHASRHLPCTGNLLLFYEDLDDDKLAAANKQQFDFEAAARRSGVSTTYTGVLSAQAFGPLRSFLVPHGYKCSNSHALWKKYNLDPESAIQADIAHLIAFVRDGELDTSLEEVPLLLLV